MLWLLVDDIESSQQLREQLWEPHGSGRLPCAYRCAFRAANKPDGRDTSSKYRLVPGSSVPIAADNACNGQMVEVLHKLHVPSAALVDLTSSG